MIFAYVHKPQAYVRTVNQVYVIAQHMFFFLILLVFKFFF